MHNSVSRQRTARSLVFIVVLMIVMVGTTAVWGARAAEVAGGAANNAPNSVLANPAIADTNPDPGAIVVRRDIFIGANLLLPNLGAGVNPATLITDTVRLVRTSDGAIVPADLNTSGGGDVVVLDPTVTLEAFTNYTFLVTSGLQDTTGAAFVPYQMSFTTGSAGGPIPGGTIAFDQIPLLDTVNSQGYTSLQIGPDGKLYATTLDGRIVRYVLNSDGTTGISQTITTIKTYNPSIGPDRMLIGFVFGPDANSSNLVAWVSHSHFALSGGVDWTGRITRLSGPNLEFAEDYVVGLPRSSKDHLSNSLTFQATNPSILSTYKLYMTQGSNSAMGEADSTWALRPEHLLTGAVLEIDVFALSNAPRPLDVKTEAGGTYDPFAANARVKLFATGVRNAYDMVWHSINGQLYVPTNGSAAGGIAPATPANFANLPACQQRIDDASKGDYIEPAVVNVPNIGIQNDFLFRVVRGGYYGHPNPTRCEWVLNGGNPSSGVDPAEVAGNPSNPNNYPVGTQPDRNWRGFAYDFGINKSPNGIIEYKNGVFSNGLKNKLLVIRYSAGNDIMVMTPDGPNGDIKTVQTSIPGFGGFNDPLDLVENTANGFLYVSEYGLRRIVLLKPNTQATGRAEIMPAKRVFSDVAGGVASANQTFVIKNTGSSNLSVTGVALVGPNGQSMPFQLGTISPALPRSLSPGASISVQVAFNPTVVGPRGAILKVTTTDRITPVIEGILYGLGTTGTGGTNEPSLQWIMNTYEMAINDGDDDVTTNKIHSNTATASSALLGDEIPADYFIKAVAGLTVTIEPVAVFGPNGPNGNVVHFGWNAAGDPNNTTELFTVANASSQTLNPTANGDTSFDPGNTPFGFYSKWPFFGDRMVYSEDELNTFSGALPHHVRVYQYVSSDGPVPNTYVVATEEHTSGYDYQDIVVIVRNVVPVRPDVNVKINFQSAPARIPQGYVRDFGEAFGPRGLTGQGDSKYVYGWVNPNDDHPRSPRNLSIGGSFPGNGRDRDQVGTDQRLDTLMHMRAGDVGASFNGTPLNGAWEMQVPNGIYQVTVAVGDSLNDDGNDDNDLDRHTINVEGVNAINDFHAIGLSGTATRHKVASVCVAVADRRLTIDAIGGINTKINYADIMMVAQCGVPIPTATATSTAVVPTATATNTAVVPTEMATNTAVVPTATATNIPATATSTTPTATTPTATGTTPTAISTTPTATAGTPVLNKRVYLPLLVKSTAVQKPGGAVVPAFHSKAMLRPITNLVDRSEHNQSERQPAAWWEHIFAQARVMRAAQSITAQCFGAGNITVENLESKNIPYNDRMVFSKIQSPQTGATNYNWSRTTGILRVRNTGVGPLNVSSINFTGPWALSNTLTLPTVLAAGTFLDVPVKFTANTGPPSPGGGQVYDGSMTINSNDANESSKVIELSGWWQPVNEADNEPDMQELVGIFGYDIRILYAGQSFNNAPRGATAAMGEEILSPYWTRVDAGKPVRVVQLAALHQCCQAIKASDIAWYAKGQTGIADANDESTHEPAGGQTLLPRNFGGTSLFDVAMNPTGVFQFRIAKSAWGDDTLNTGGQHFMRVWPVRDRAGVLVPNTYLVSMDFNGINYDYNDNVYLINNIRPEVATVDQTIHAKVSGAPGLELDFDQAIAGTLEDSAAQGTGFTAVQRNAADSVLPTPGTSFNSANLDLNTANGTLTVQTTAGTNDGNTNTQVNALQLPFDGRSSSFIVSGRINGPLPTAANQEAGVFIGPEKDNYIKAHVTANGSGQPIVQLVSETNGTRSVVSTSAALPTTPTITSLEVMLFGDPWLGTIRAGYKINGGTTVMLGTGQTLTNTGRYNRFFDRNSEAGIITTNKAAASFSAVYDRFAIRNNEPTATRPTLWRIDTGSANAFTDSNGQLWQGDAGLFTPANAIAEGTGTPPIDNTLDDTIYQTYRGNVNNPSRTLTYTLSIPNTVQKVDVRLHIAELYWGAPGGGSAGPGKRVFDVIANGSTILNDFDPTAAIGAARTAIIVPIEGIAVTNGVLQLAFDAEIDYASIAGIEVFASTSANGNVPPAINAGNDQQVPRNASVTLTGTANDYEGSGLTLAWTQISGPAVTLNGSGNNRTFTAPNADTTLVFQFTATDGAGNVSSDTVEITVGDTAISDLTLTSNAPSSPNDAVTFQAFVACGSNIIYDWNFGDGVTVSETTGKVRHAYATVGTYTASVTARNSSNSVSNSTSVSILPLLTRFNAGGLAIVTTPDGISWATDRHSTNGFVTEHTGVGDITGTDNDVIYYTERYGTAQNIANPAQYILNYAIPVPLSGNYTVRLHFAETFFGVAPGVNGQRNFDVTLEGSNKLSNFNPASPSGPRTARIFVYVANVTDGVLNLDLVGRNGSRPTIKAIEVFGSAGMTFPSPTPVPSQPATATVPAATATIPATTQPTATSPATTMPTATSTAVPPTETAVPPTVTSTPTTPTAIVPTPTGTVPTATPPTPTVTSTPTTPTAIVPTPTGTVPTVTLPTTTATTTPGTQRRIFLPLVIKQASSALRGGYSIAPLQCQVTAISHHIAGMASLWNGRSVKSVAPSCSISAALSR